MSNKLQFISVRLPVSTVKRIMAEIHGKEKTRSQWVREAIEWKLSAKVTKLPGPDNSDRPLLVHVEA